MIPPPSFLPHTARRRWPVLEWTSARTPTERAPPPRLSCDLGEGLRTPKRGGGAACLWSSWGRLWRHPLPSWPTSGLHPVKEFCCRKTAEGGGVDMTFLIPILLWVFMMSSSLICPQHFLFVVGSCAGGKPNSWNNSALWCRGLHSRAADEAQKPSQVHPDAPHSPPGNTQCCCSCTPPS